ncbi:hypothetical protein CFN78_10895 [Amycolatopsis antarctica]|uniref:VTT domain-containing protein n=1 Tax=Amycolatopsis antarctica TaxID=1854586 RepID=A0A263D7F9_9PSEU|nr:DedA family protein [Amycolatopsis antarctica]OZM73345.1 hypothetical protein CFN78_10895 [Amycolatopsis antarctica]
MDASTAALLVLFVIALVPLVPTEVALLGMGVAAAQGQAELLPAIVVAAVGCLLSDQVLYQLARHRGVTVLDRLRRRRNVDNGLRWIDRHAEDHLHAILVIARWLPSGGTVGSLLAGAMRWPRMQFLTASAIGVTLWSGYVALLGYLGGQFVQEPGVSLLISLAIAAALGACLSAVVRRRVENT